MKRPDLDTYYLNIAKVVSERSTCLKKHYGAVLVKNGEIIRKCNILIRRARGNNQESNECSN